MEKYYTTSQAAKLCHMSPGSIIRWIREGKLKTAFTPGGHRRIRQQELFDFMMTLHMEIPKQQEAAGRSKKSSFKVLVVDDETVIQDIITLFLDENFKKIEIKKASSGFEAGWVAWEFQPHLIILDLMMPDFDGFAVCQAIRSSSELKHIKIIAMTGFGDENGEKAIQAGADDYLTKPFNFDLFIEKVKTYLNHAEADYELLR